jgi:hypothetical protein
VLETLVMMLVRLTGGRVGEVFFGVGHEAKAFRCTSGHPIVFFAGDPPEPPGPAHLHVSLRVWSKGGHASTILSFSAERLRKRMELDTWRSAGTSVLQASGQPVDIEFVLWPIPKEGQLPYSVGDRLPVELKMSRGWTKKLTVSVVKDAGA